MTANVTFGNNFKGAENYQANKIVNGVNHSELIHFENVAPEYQVNKNNELEIKPLSIAQDMKNHAKSENTKVQKPVMNVSFNFHNSENLTNEKMNKACLKALEHVGVDKENHQITIRRHYDTAHPHAHVTVNRVGLNGKVHDNSFIANRLQVACDKVEKEQNLRPTKGRIFVFDPIAEKGYRKQSQAERKRTTEPKQTKKQKINAVQKRVLAEFNAEKKESKNFEEIRERLAKKDIQMNIATNKNGVYGLSFKSDEIAVKASRIGIKVKEVKQQLQQNQSMNEVQRRFLKIHEKRKAEQSLTEQKAHFERQTKKLYDEVSKDIRENQKHPLGLDIREKMINNLQEVDPKKNIWNIVDELGGRDWQDKLQEHAEKEYKLIQSKEMDKNREQLQKPIVSTESGKPKAEMKGSQKKNQSQRRRRR